jgi:hypothetical protein
VWGDLSEQSWLSRGWVNQVAKFCFDWEFQILFGLIALAIEGTVCKFFFFNLGML